MKGRKPKDLALKILSGNPGKRATEKTDGEDPFFVSDLAKPDCLDEYASQEWDRLVSRLKPILSSGHAGMVFVAVNAYSDMRHAMAAIETEGRTYTTVNQHGQEMIRQRPEVAMLQQARTQYARALAELGASPVAGTRVKKLPENNQQDLPGMHKLLG